MDTVQNYFILCAWNINARVLCEHIFTAKINTTRPCSVCSAMDHRHRGACQGLCQCCQDPSEHGGDCTVLACCGLSVGCCGGENVEGPSGDGGKTGREALPFQGRGASSIWVVVECGGPRYGVWAVFFLPCLVALTPLLLSAETTVSRAEKWS